MSGKVVIAAGVFDQLGPVFCISELGPLIADIIGGIEALHGWKVIDIVKVTLDKMILAFSYGRRRHNDETAGPEQVDFKPFILPRSDAAALVVVLIPSMVFAAAAAGHDRRMTMPVQCVDQDGLVRRINVKNRKFIAVSGIESEQLGVAELIL